MNDVVLIGFMGSGKSSVGRRLAERLGRPFVDLDDLIAAAAGRRIPAIFANEGEAGFRRREAACLVGAVAGDGRVIAVGGGAPLADENWHRLREGNWVVALNARPATLAARLGDADDRPLLAGGAGAAIDRLLPARLARYSQADLVVSTDDRAPDQVAEEIRDRLPFGPLARIAVPLPGAAHEITIGRRLAGLLPGALERAGVSGSVVVVTDEGVAPRHASCIEAACKAGGRTVHRFTLPSGEPAKALANLSSLYDFMATVGVDRQGAVVAVGGGAVGDVAGFAAATWMRGIPWVQVPTTLLAMVDSSIGGKTGFNLSTGKNLVGAVHQPAAILSDLGLLETLPAEEYGAAFAEILKSALVADAAFFEWLSDRREKLLNRAEGDLMEAVVRTASIKVAVVAADPSDRGPRAILNYGHTAGHALESVLGYGSVRHGDAVAWGMQVAARISVLTDRCGPEVEAAQERELRGFGFLAFPPAVSAQMLVEAMRHDKKVVGGTVRWVLLHGIGKPELGCGVPPAVVDRALREVFGG